MNRSVKSVCRSYLIVEVEVVAHRMTLHGELDLHSSKLLADAGELLLGEAPSCAEISLAGVEFIDAAGIGALVRLRNKFREVGGTLLITHVRPRVERTFSCAGTAALLG